MPYPLLHLILAQAYANTLHVKDLGAFYLGTLAPDAYACQPNATWQDRWRPHLQRQDSTNWRGDVIAHYQANPPKQDFDRGYGLHLLTDLAWEERVISRYVERWTQQNKPEPSWRSGYTLDMGRLDVRLYVLSHAQERIWPLLMAAEPWDHALVSAKELYAERARTLPWYAARINRAQEPLTVFSYAEMADMLTQIAETIHQDLQNLGWVAPGEPLPALPDLVQEM